MDHPSTHNKEGAKSVNSINTPDIGHDDALGSEELRGDAIEISKYSKALITSWLENHTKVTLSPNKISVSQTVSLIAFLYEKMRNAVEFREEHLIKRATIERIIKRRMLLNENGRDIAEVLIKELLWARYYENNTIGEEKIPEVQGIIDKYFFIRNEISAGRSSKEQERIGQFILEVLSCEIEELLSPDHRREAFTNYVYQIIRPQIAPVNNNVKDRDILVYVAVERAFAHSDNPLISYHLLKLVIPEITRVSWKTADNVIPQFYASYQEITKSLRNEYSDKIFRYVKKQMPPFFIMRDIFNKASRSIESILTDEAKLKDKVDEACRKRYEETKDRLRRTGIRSFIYIVLTKVLFAFLIEFPYDKYIVQSVSYIPLGINIIFPPVLMGVIILSVRIPGDENTKKIFQLIKGIIANDPSDAETRPTLILNQRIRVKSPLFTTLFTLIYLFTYLVSFGTIIYVLTLLKFSVVSQGIFIFFVTLVTFFAFRVVSITKEYLVIENESAFTPVIDFFSIPVMRVGQILSDEVLTKFNILIFFFDFIIEMPLKAIVEVIDEWARFVRLKKEEIV
ncbi:hypothetical protein HYW55_02050 [Candidatus Gottesmanbacteria bacterium]|nr:hypothetical protein [Candidatus Gottesmanbacteria bacterium]